jgi:Sulfotransferase domain
VAHPEMMDKCDLFQDFVETVRKIALFLGKSVTEDRLLKIVRVTRLEEMRTNNALNYLWCEDSGTMDKEEGKFLRKGIQ